MAKYYVVPDSKFISLKKILLQLRMTFSKNTQKYLMD